MSLFEQAKRPCTHAQNPEQPTNCESDRECYWNRRAYRRQNKIDVHATLVVVRENEHGREDDRDQEYHGNAFEHLSAARSALDREMPALVDPLTQVLAGLEVRHVLTG